MRLAVNDVSRLHIRRIDEAEDIAGVLVDLVPQVLHFVLALLLKTSHGGTP